MFTHSVEDLANKDILGYRVPERTLYDWKQKATVVKRDIPTEVIIAGAQKSIDVIDHAIDIAKGASDRSISVNDSIRAAKALGQLALWRAQISGEMAPIKSQNVNVNVTAREMFKDILRKKDEPKHD
jgi:hypothetical protein